MADYFYRAWDLYLERIWIASLPLSLIACGVEPAFIFVWLCFIAAFCLIFDVFVRGGK